MNQPPLNPDALWKKIEAFCENMAETGQMDRMEAIDLLIEAQEHLAVAHPVVNSVEELDALPPESYVQGWDGFKHAKTHSGDWVLCVEHTRGSHNSESIELPARVLYRPEVKP